MAKISERIGRSQAVILPARLIRFEIEAISTSFGFDPFCPPRRRSRSRSRMVLRQKALRYIHIPAASFLALSKMASNLEGIFNRS
jgi:hypothetical protein